MENIEQRALNKEWDMQKKATRQVSQKNVTTIRKTQGKNKERWRNNELKKQSSKKKYVEKIINW